MRDSRPPLLALSAALLSLAAAAPARAQSVWPPPAAAQQNPSADELAGIKAGGPVGLGVAVGSRPGITLRVWPRRPFALSVQVGSTWLLNSVSADVSANFVAPAARNQAGTVAALFYGGVGFRTQVWFGSDSSYLELAVRVPLGVSIVATGWRVEPFAEAAPTLAFYESVGFGVEGLIGARYYF